MPAKEFDAFTRLDASDVNAYLANKSISNAIINGAFEINQRGFSSSTATAYGFDRWFNVGLGNGTSTFSAQTFTPGTTPATNFQASNFLRCVTTGQSSADVLTRIDQRVEDVRSFAGETVTFSFYAKSASGTPKITIEVGQSFGSGGSSPVNTFVSQITISTNWQRYSVTFQVPSVTGKTIGASSLIGFNLWFSSGTDYNARTGSLGIQSNTFDIWGVQLEPGTVANDFRRNANSIQGELAACQRYFETSFNWDFGPTNGANTTTFATTNGLYAGVSMNTANSNSIQFKVPKRGQPTVALFGNSNGHWGYTTSSAGLTFDVNTFGLAAIGLNSFTGQQGVVNNTFVVVQGHWTASADL